MPLWPIESDPTPTGLGNLIDKLIAIADFILWLAEHIRVWLPHVLFMAVVGVMLFCAAVGSWYFLCPDTIATWKIIYLAAATALIVLVLTLITTNDQTLNE